MPKSIVRVFLRSGTHFDITAENVKVSRSSMTGELREIEWEDAESGAPLFIRLEAVEAVVEMQ